jgi:hypothetical protein
MQSTMNERAQRGRYLLAAAAAISLFGDGVIILLKIASVGLFASGGSVIRWFITAVLFYVMWQGYQWARWIMVALLSIGLLLFLPIVFRNPQPLFIAIAAQFGAAVGLLAFPPSVSAFMAFQRTRQSENA